MKKICFFILILTLPILSFAHSTTTQLTPAQQCQSLACVRKNIDIINQQLLTALGERLAYVKRAGELKRASGEAVYAPKREQQIIENVTAQAKQRNIPEGFAKNIFECILKQSRLYEAQFKLPPAGSTRTHSTQSDN